MTNPVSVDDLESRFRPLADAEKGVAASLLSDAWAVLLTAVPSLEQRRADGSVSVDLVIYVVSAMVLRVLRNPEGIRQWSVDDASFTRDQALSAGGLYVSPEEVGLLAGSPVGPVGHVSFSAKYC